LIEIKKAVSFETAFFLCPGTELNRYGHCCPQDFKSCVSTNSTTRAIKKNPSANGGRIFGAEDRARTGHPDLGKVVLYQMSYFRLFFAGFETRHAKNFGVAKIGHKPFLKKF
jgi:hypothetical protein